MTRIWIVSDLHMDHGRIDLPVPSEADVAVIAGDVVDDEWLAGIAARIPTVYVAGNHDFYNKDWYTRRAELAAIPTLHFLDDDVAVVAGVTFAGATLWTNMNDGDHSAIEAAADYMNDYRHIRMGKDQLRPWATVAMNENSVQAIKWATKIAPRLVAGPVVVVTHHAPSFRSVHQRFVGAGAINYAFASNLDNLVEESGAAIWVHGHVHNNFDYMIGGTRVICNPYGYPGENPEFDPALIVEV